MSCMNCLVPWDIFERSHVTGSRYPIHHFSPVTSLFCCSFPSSLLHAYSHQADVGHAYQIVKKHGIPAERIITMAYDDIAKNSQNPFPGQVFNKPTAAGVPGVNVWENIQLDYTGNTVTANNFLNIIAGNATGVNGGNGKVVQSTQDDNIFIYYSDHGSVGSIAFPAGAALQVSALQRTLKSMAAAKRFKKLVFYLEACESGSMFEGWLPNNLNIYATTAANAHESSWGFYCSPQDVVNGKKIGSCLGDEYSITWLESVDNIGLDQTLASNYEYVKTNTKKSHVMQYGDTSFVSDTLGDFLSEKKSTNVVRLPRHPMFDQPRPVAAGSENVGRINSRDIKLHYHFDRYMDATRFNTPEERFEEGVEMLRELQHRLNEDLKFTEFARRLVGEKSAVLMHSAETPRSAYLCGSCCEEAFKVIYSPICGGFSDYSLKYGRTIHNVCMSGPDMTKQVVSTLTDLCTKPVTVSI